MAAGRAIVVSDLPVLREILTHERNALIVPPDDIDTWAAAIRKLIANRALRNSIGSQARADFLAKYTWFARARNVVTGI
jgi:glycosyltransferase involved in cell wall biosynthesis